MKQSCGDIGINYNMDSSLSAIRGINHKYIIGR